MLHTEEKDNKVAGLARAAHLTEMCSPVSLRLHDVS